MLQIALMDITTLEQVAVMDEDWPLPATRINIVVLMDVKTHVIYGWQISMRAEPRRNVHAGDNRGDVPVRTATRDVREIP